MNPSLAVFLVGALGAVGVVIHFAAQRQQQLFEAWQAWQAELARRAALEEERRQEAAIRERVAAQEASPRVATAHRPASAG